MQAARWKRQKEKTGWLFVCVLLRPGNRLLLLANTVHKNWDWEKSHRESPQSSLWPHSS
jgi:hypothetical protein